MESDEYQLEIDKKEHAYSILESFGIMREIEEHSDLIIKVGDKEMRVNRDLMIAASGYISGMFAHDTMEKKTGVLDMKDVEFDLVKKCVDFIYTGKISVSLNKCEDLLYVASLMQLWTLREHIGVFLAKRLSISCFFQIWNLALKFSMKKLNQICQRFANENLEMLAKEEEFANQDADVLTSFLSEIKSSRPGGEDRKIPVILNWINHNLEERCQDVVEVMKSVDLEMVSQTYRRSLIESEPIIYQSAECMRMFFLATMNNYGVKRQKLDAALQYVPNALIVFDVISHCMKAYIPSRSMTKISVLHPEMREKKYTAVAVRRHVYVLMEHKKVFRLNAVEVGQGWEEMSEMHNTHGPHLSGAVLDDYIYVAGNDSMERYSLRDNEWKQIESNGVSLRKPALVAHQDEIYNVGDSVSEAQKYSPQFGVWATFAPMQARRETLRQAISFEEKIYSVAFRGYNGFGSRTTYCTCYDKNSNEWSDVPSAVNDISNNMKLCVVDNTLVMVGDRLDIFQYDSSKKAWECLSSHGLQVYNNATISMWLPSNTESERIIADQAKRRKKHGQSNNQSIIFTIA